MRRPLSAILLLSLISLAVASPYLRFEDVFAATPVGEQNLWDFSTAVVSS